MTDISLLVADLQTDEGWRSFLYDDATGAAIKPGSVVKGHPTAAWGFALDVAPLTKVEALPILTSRATTAMQGLIAAAPWVADLPEPCQRALGNMAYNMGVSGLLKFHTFLGLMEQRQFEAAADDLAGTAWYGQVGDRAKRIQDLIKGV